MVEVNTAGMKEFYWNVSTKYETLKLLPSYVDESAHLKDNSFVVMWNIEQRGKAQTNKRKKQTTEAKKPKQKQKDNNK